MSLRYEKYELIKTITNLIVAGHDQSHFLTDLMAYCIVALLDYSKVYFCFCFTNNVLLYYSTAQCSTVKYNTLQYVRCSAVESTMPIP